ncbi:MAG: polysaccharide biosynthesis protein [Thermoleophilia bacterium]
MIGRISKRRTLAMVIDVAIVVLAYYLALAFRFAGHIPEYLAYSSRNFLIFAALASVTHLLANRLAAVYAIVNRYVGLPQALRVGYASVAATAVLLVVTELWPGEQHLLPLSVVLLGGLMAGVIMTGVRFYGRVFHEHSLTNVGHERRLLLVGAGQAADMIMREIHRNPALRARVVGLLDDDPALQGMRPHNHPVLGRVADVLRVVHEHDVSEILICIPSATSDEMARIHRTLRHAGVPIKTLPSLQTLVDGAASLADARALNIEDLLGRPRVHTDLGAIAAYLQGRRVLITGAGGSIGSELSRQIAGFRPEELVLVDRDESALYQLHEDLKRRGFAGYELVPANILRRAKMERLFERYRPQVVFHAAAFKHVPLMELHPDEAVLNNVRGTLVVAELAGEASVERFVNISTDKAVDPVNVMGATKRAAEHVVRMLSARHPATRYCSVRFGNVLGSRGSVVPIFERQIKAGGPVTITHPEMTRYFMMIPEAVQLVLQAAALVEEIPARAATAGDNGNGGATSAAPSGHGDTPAPPAHYGAFVLEMGEPVRIVDLARQMIEFLANGGAGSIDMEFTGLRPGERLHENLICSGECPAPTSHPLIKLALLDSAAGAAAADTGTAAPHTNGRNVSDLPPDFEAHLASLLALADRHALSEQLIVGLRACVPTYEPFDWSQVGSFPGATARTPGIESPGAATPTGAARSQA